MHESGSSRRNETQGGGQQRASSGPRPISEQTKRIREESTTLATEVRTLASDVSGSTTELRSLVDQLREQPFQTLGMAAAFGYILGGGLKVRLTDVVMATATQLTASLSDFREIAQLASNMKTQIARMTEPENRPRP